MTTQRKDALAIAVLVVLWLLFFWRLFTPIEADQASLKQGDFSGQFVAFGAYQYERLTKGEVPLWNPYNNGGLPFIADTQAAVFYPPRLLTIALSSLIGGWRYHALELEMAFHVLVYSLMMYLLVRRMTLGQGGSVIGGLGSAIIGSYGGFLSGYAPLQLAILEAGIWLPLAILGILEAARQARIQRRWLVLSGFALGLSWMAGHPQTSWFLTYLLTAYLAYQIVARKYRWTAFAIGLMLIAIVSGGMAAVQLLPGLEYLVHTARVDLSFDAKGNGFPFKDILQFLFPTQLSLFSPLYIGITALALVTIFIWRRTRESLFWFIVAATALGLSFGANSAIFPALYNILPGLRFFRGQERAAYLVVNSLATLAGLSLSHFISQPIEQQTRRNIRWTLIGIVALCGAGIALAHTGWLSERPIEALNTAVFSTAIASLTLLILFHLLNHPSDHRAQILLVALIVLDLFTINMDADNTYDPIPANQQLSATPPALVARALADADSPFRVDGFRGLQDNFGSLYQLADMRGISPLFLDGPFQIIEPEKINPLAWELFAVRYVYSDWQELPVASELIDTGEDRFGPINLHRLQNPRPFAHLVYRTEIADSDEFARELLRDPNFDPRNVIILSEMPETQLTEPKNPGTAEVTNFRPEHMTIAVTTPENVILSLSHPDYPGWEVSLDGKPTSILRAYGALTAIAVPAGDHEINLVYNPRSYRIGALLSLVTGLGLGILGAFWWIRRRA